MLFRPSDTFLIEFHVQHGSSHNEGMYKTWKFHAVQTRICILAYQYDCESCPMSVLCPGFRFALLFSDNRGKME